MKRTLHLFGPTRIPKPFRDRPPPSVFHPPQRQGSCDDRGRVSAGRPVIEVSAFRKTYGSTVAVDDVTFEVRDGEIFGLIGPNGAGKTTTMECVEGLRTPDRGT